MIGAIRGGLFFAFLSKELSLQFLVFAAEMFDFSLQLLNPLHGSGMLAFPIAGLLPQFQVLPPQIVHFLAQVRHFLAQFPHHSQPFSRENFPGTLCNHAFHDR